MHFRMEKRGKEARNENYEGKERTKNKKLTRVLWTDAGR